MNEPDLGQGANEEQAVVVPSPARQPADSGTQYIILFIYQSFHVEQILC